MREISSSKIIQLWPSLPLCSCGRFAFYGILRHQFERRSSDATLPHAAHARLPHAPGSRSSRAAHAGWRLAHAERVLVNMLEGKMFVEFRADSRENLEAWLKTEGMHFDWLVRVEWEMQGDKLQIAD